MGFFSHFHPFFFIMKTILLSILIFFFFSFFLLIILSIFFTEDKLITATLITSEKNNIFLDSIEIEEKKKWKGRKENKNLKLCEVLNSTKMEQFRVPICKPIFQIIGTMKGGTSSLMSYLASHPEVK